ncbi:MAG TPA: glutamate--tRNA ligase family protein, partial [Planctomycetaceae bacterium]|nr:glutamate--tRNA ligase family protein [Planctomycetaceae bacterium]
IYPRTCAWRTACDAASLGNKLFAWRFRTTGELCEFHDQILGMRSLVPNRDLGDFVIGKKDGSPAYQLAVVCDDHAMGVTEVLRGDDLLPSAFRQLELFAAFGWSPPTFAHVPLVVGPDGRRLAKRHGDTRLATLRQQGVSAKELLGLLAWSSGLRPTLEKVSAKELLADFALERIARQPFVFEPERLRHEAR